MTSKNKSKCKLMNIEFDNIQRSRITVMEELKVIIINIWRRNNKSIKDNKKIYL